MMNNKNIIYFKTTFIYHILIFKIKIFFLHFLNHYLNKYMYMYFKLIYLHLKTTKHILKCVFVIYLPVLILALFIIHFILKIQLK